MSSSGIWGQVGGICSLIDLLVECPVGSLCFRFTYWNGLLYHRYRKEVRELLYCLCNSVIHHRAPIGGFMVFADHACRNGQKKCTHNLSLLCGASCMLIFKYKLISYAPDKLWLFWPWEKSEYPSWDEDGADSGIFILYPWAQLIKCVTLPIGLLDTTLENAYTLRYYTFS